MTTRDQGKEFLGDGVGGCRAIQAPLQMAKGRMPVLALNGDRSEVEEHERIVGAFRQFFQKNGFVAGQFAAP